MQRDDDAYYAEEVASNEEEEEEEGFKQVTETPIKLISCRFERVPIKARVLAKCRICFRPIEKTESQRFATFEKPEMFVSSYGKKRLFHTSCMLNSTSTLQAVRNLGYKRSNLMKGRELLSENLQHRLDYELNLLHKS